MATEQPPGIDVRAVESALAASLPGAFHGPVSAELIAGGRSNLTYRLTDGQRQLVLRRPPLGHVLQTAHDMAREYRLLAALHPTDVPVPRPLLLADAMELGFPYYVMEYVEGSVLRGVRQLEQLAPAAQDIADQLATMLSRLHRIEPAQVGLADLGRPDGYLARQLHRWQRQLQSSESRELLALERLASRLEATLPPTGKPAIVHGDYRLDNVLVETTSHRIVAVLDWEMATLGDPLTDLGSAVVWWDGLSGLDSPVAAVPGDVAGFPTRDQLLETYAKETSADLTALPWYVGFAYYKIAAIFEGIHFRARQGLTVGEGFDRLGALVPALVERGHAALAATAE